jgi:polyphosphate kinase
MPQVYCASADWMERNLSNRIEVCFPILKKKLANRIVSELNLYLNDRTQSWELQSNGNYLIYKQDGDELLPAVQAQLLQNLS